ncbi:MAG TPA: hypothetical protein VMT76_17920 [Puia sp.]|nr:hypothetical protein [Puia sp.]
MKLILTIALLFLIGCSGNGKKENVNMPGVYRMISQSIKGGNIDTTYRSLAQLKIFTSDHLMFANVNQAGTVGSFGIGTYTVNGDTIIENIFLRGSDSTKTETPAEYKLIIVKTGKGYQQVIPDFTSNGQKYVLSEDYESVGMPAKSTLDGVWKLSLSYHIKGNDTTTNNITQYKMYDGGYFIWGQSRPDTARKNITAVGFGKFTLEGNKLQEYLMESTNAEIRSLDVHIDIEMKGDTVFKQTISNKDSTRDVETYVRVTKE